VLSLFSCSDECVLVVILEDGREESRELARCVHHADGNGDMCSPNSFNKGVGCRRSSLQRGSERSEPGPNAFAVLGPHPNPEPDFRSGSGW
jgi:hypothetical protein